MRLSQLSFADRTMRVFCLRLGSSLILRVLRSGLRGLKEINQGFELRLNLKDESIQDLGLSECFHVWVSRGSFGLGVWSMYIGIYMYTL